MRILYIITKSNWGGAQRHVFDLATSMKQKGHDVYVALGGDGVLRDRLEAAGVFTFSIASMGRDMSATKDASSLKEIYSVIKSKKPDILHLHSPKAAGLGAFAGRLLRIPSIIYTVHGWTFNEERPSYQRAAIVFLSWLTMLLSHTVILLSDRELAQSRRFPWVSRKLRLIPLGIKPPMFMSVEGAKQFISKKIGLDSAEFGRKTVIGTIAELHPNKGLTYLMDAMPMVVAQNPHAICVIIGDGQDKAVLHMQIKERKLEQAVYLAGNIDQASEYLKALNIFVLPSVKEGLPYTILEAGCASLPVVASTVGGIPTLIDDMRTGLLVQPRNIRELSHALSFMVEHPEERRRCGDALREKIVTHFSLEKMLAETEKIYEESDPRIQEKA